jgi:hypothetical protein
MSWLNVQHRVNATANIAVVGVMLLMVLIVLVIVFPFRVGLLSLPYTIYYIVLPI